MLQQEARAAEIRTFMEEIYNSRGRKEDLTQLDDKEIVSMAQALTTGVPFATPVFDGASEQEIQDMLHLAYPEELAQRKGLTESRTQAYLYDGRTGDRFERPTTIGYMHYLKLHHLVDDKMHARSEEHTSELQSPCNLVCRLLLEKKKIVIASHYFA